MTQYEQNQRVDSYNTYGQYGSSVPPDRVYSQSHSVTKVDQSIPICVLKIELDADGDNVEEIRVYDGDDPKTIVH